MHRKTAQRESILKILKATRSHPTADDIYDKVRKQIPNISKGTVYRNLKILEDTGKIRELNLNGTASRYEAAISNHYHFRCEKCGRVIDLDEPVNEDLNNKVSRQTGLIISNHILEFSGLCHECQASAVNKKSFSSS
jgi:Fur family peroxide stress response transcriptional regulator